MRGPCFFFGELVLPFCLRLILGVLRAFFEFSVFLFLEKVLGFSIFAIKRLSSLKQFRRPGRCKLKVVYDPNPSPPPLLLLLLLLFSIDLVSARNRSETRLSKAFLRLKEVDPGPSSLSCRYRLKSLFQ